MKKLIFFIVVLLFSVVAVFFMFSQKKDYHKKISALMANGDDSCGNNVWDVIDYCDDIFLHTNNTSCFPEGLKGSYPWTNFGNAIFYLSTNRIDLFRQEIAKIGDKESIWYLFSLLEESFYKNNMKNAAKILDSFEKKVSICSENSADLLVEYKLMFFANEGRFEKLSEMFGKESLKKKIENSNSLPQFYVDLLLIEKKNDELLKFAEDLVRSKNDDMANVAYAAYFWLLKDPRKALRFYRKINNPYLSFGYFDVYMDMKKVSEEEIHKKLRAIKFRPDFVISKIIQLRNNGENEVAKYMEKLFFSEDSMSIFEKYWGDSSYFNTWSAQIYIDRGNFDYANYFLQKSLEISPRDYEANWVKYKLCKIYKDEPCQKEAWAIVQIGSSFDEE